MQAKASDEEVKVPILWPNWDEAEDTCHAGYGQHV